jgi:hypothetical protein
MSRVNSFMLCGTDDINQAPDWRAEHRSQSSQLDRFDYELRPRSFGLTSNATTRAVFVIRDAMVLILRIWHLAQSEI